MRVRWLAMARKGASVAPYIRTFSQYSLYIVLYPDQNANERCGWSKGSSARNQVG